MLSSLSLGVKTKQYFVCSSNVFLDKKTVLKIWINPGLNVTIFRGTGRWTPDQMLKSELTVSVIIFSIITNRKPSFFP